MNPLQRLRPALMSLALASAMIGAPAVLMAQDARALVIARDMDVNSLDPQRGWCDTCQIYNTSVYEQLTTLDKDNKLIPLLATSWEGNADQSVFTFKLDPAAKFSDGSAVEAKDVKWSFERLKNLKADASFLTDSVTSIETPDAGTVVFTLTGPNSEFPGVAAAPYLAILNSDVLIEQGAVADATAVDADKGETWLMANSAGSGPFVLDTYEPNAELRLLRNDAYWRTAAGVPGVVFRQVKDAVSQAQMLQSGTVDIAMQIDPETAKSLEGGEMKVETVPSYNFVYLALAPGAKSNTIKMTPVVREAISLAIDRQGVIDFTLGGAGQLIAAPIPLGFPGGAGHTVDAYNPERAKELLKQEGLEAGFTLDATYPDMNVYGVDFSVMMQKVQSDLAKVGIDAKLAPVPLANWRELANGGGIALTAVFFAPDFYGTSQYVDVFGLGEGSTWARRAGAEADPSILNAKTGEIKAQALAAATPEAADKLWFEAGEMMVKDRIILPMVSPDLVLAYGPTIKGVRYSACCNLPLAEITN